MDQSFWESLKKFMISGIGDMLQAQKSQKQTSATPGAHAGRREFYSEWALTSLMGCDQVYTESDIPIILGKFQMSKECADNHQDLMTWMTYWTKTDGIEIDAAVLFAKLAIE